MTQPAEQGPRRPQERFTEGSRNVLQLAEREAKRFNHNYIGTEHILLGLTASEYSDPANQALSNLGISLEKVRSGVEFIIGRGERTVIGNPDLTPRGKKVIELAVELARGESQKKSSIEITTLHLLQGLVHEDEGITAGILESLGVSLDKVRRELHRVKALQESKAEEEMIRRLENVLHNTNISSRTRTFVLGIVDQLTSFAQQEAENQPPTV